MSLSIDTNVANGKARAGTQTMLFCCETKGVQSSGRCKRVIRLMSAPAPGQKNMSNTLSAVFICVKCSETEESWAADNTIDFNLKRISNCFILSSRAFLLLTHAP